jgi:hypothetical protein
MGRRELFILSRMAGICGKVRNCNCPFLDRNSALQQQVTVLPWARQKDLPGSPPGAPGPTPDSCAPLGPAQGWALRGHRVCVCVLVGWPPTPASGNSPRAVPRGNSVDQSWWPACLCVWGACLHSWCVWAMLTRNDSQCLLERQIGNQKPLTQGTSVCFGTKSIIAESQQTNDTLERGQDQGFRRRSDSPLSTLTRSEVQ